MENMVKGTAVTGRIPGIRLQLHYTCALAAVTVGLIVSSQLPESYSFWQKAALGAGTAALYVILLVARELALAPGYGRGQGRVKNITVYAFGGVCQTAEELTLPNHELLMAGARLLSSLATAAVMYGFFALSVYTDNFTATAVTEWLAFIWTGLLLFNFLPGFPLDAGMALRALLLKRWGNLYRATCNTSAAGRYMGLVLVFTGVLAFIVTRQWLTALALIVTGWCLQSASGTIRRQASLAMALEGTRARDLMSGDYTTVNSQATIGQLYREYILVSGWRFFAVTDGEAVKGFLTERRIRSVPWKRRNSTCAGDIMLPLDRASAIGPGQSGASALQAMEQLKINELPVIEYGVVVGIISRDRLVRLGGTRAEFGI